MKRYFLVRHGETDLNVSGVFYGHTDCPINSKGELQAQEVGKYLSKVKFHKIYVSPLIRATYTKDLIMKENQHRNKSIEDKDTLLLTDQRLREISCGHWENKSVEEIKVLNPEYWDDFMKGWPEATMPGGESFKDLHKRMADFFHEYIKKESDEKVLTTEGRDKETDGIENILVVGHHGSIGLMLLLTMGLKINDYWKFRIGQGVYSVVTENKGQFCIEKINTKGTA